jgi:hypothetical protein
LRQLEDRQAGADVAGYYAAALHFIDPQLTIDSPLGMIEAAAETQRMLLRKQRGVTAQRRMAELVEALDFVRRSYNRVDRQAAGAGGWDGASLTAPADLRERELGMAADTSVDEAPYTGNGNGNGNGHGYSNGNGNHADSADVIVDDAGAESPEVEDCDPLVETTAPARSTNKFAAAIEQHERELLAAGPEARKSPLSRLWDADEPLRPCAEQLPEQRALPHLGGFLLLAWQVVLCLAAGLTATRLIVWPNPMLGPDVTALQAVGLTLLGVAAAAVAGWLCARYRNKSRRTALLAWATGLTAAVYLWAWYRATVEIGRLIVPPSPWVYGFAAGATLALIVAAHLYDRRSAACSEPASDAAGD